MPTTEPTLPTIKRLFVKSKNICAFPNCNLPIVEDSGTVTGIVCHIKARSKGGPRYDVKQTPEARHHFNNLILLCARHSKVIDSEPKRFTVELIGEMKEMHERDGDIELSQAGARKAEALLTDYTRVYITAGRDVMMNSPGAIQAGNVTFKTTKSKVKFQPPEGCVGSNLMQRNYLKHLIDRYNEFAKQQKDRKQPFTYAAIYGHIKKTFRAEWDKIPQTRFEEVVELVQNRINRTIIGQINTGKGIRNFSSFNRYCQEHGGQE